MDLTSLKPDRVLDTLGLLCPIPIAKTTAVVKKMDGGALLEVVSDDVGILVDMPAWCRGAGHEYLGYLEEDKGRFRVFVRKKGEGSKTI